jgi:hypothetical protein
MMKKYKLYAIDRYEGKTKKFIENNYKEYPIDLLVDELENDNGYHMRISPDSNYIFFGDCDKGL